MQEKMKPMEYNQSKRVNWIYCMQVHDKTLALVEEGYQEEDYGMHRCIWNCETSQFIHCLNENSFKPDKICNNDTGFEMTQFYN